MFCSAVVSDAQVNAAAARPFERQGFQDGREFETW